MTLLPHRPDGGLRRRGVLAGIAALASGTVRAQPNLAVDLLLVLAVDVSGSVTDEEAELQRGGYRDAMADPGVLAAVSNGVNGAIAVAYVEWARYEYQELVIPWTRIAGPAEARAWADRLQQSPRHSTYGTSLSGALAFAGRLFESSRYQSTRRVIDISGDGANNNGPPAEIERDRLVAAGVTINGLPIINRHPRFGRLELDVDKYYQDSIIGGSGAFLIVAEDFTDFAAAIKRKLVQEIAGVPAPPTGCEQQSCGTQCAEAVGPPAAPATVWRRVPMAGWTSGVAPSPRNP